MVAKVAFLHTTDERFIVLSEIPTTSPDNRRARFSLTAFDHENTFLKLAATAGLKMEFTTDIITAVLLSVAQPTFPHRWVDLDLSEPEIASLGLHADSVDASPLMDSIHIDAYAEGASDFVRSGEQFYDFLMQAPTPFLMLTGPEHRMTFINAPYLRLIGRTSYDSVLGRPVREAFPELQGKRFFALLDSVYRTGTPYVGIEAPLSLRSEQTGRFQDCFVDFIYHALRDDAGDVSGIMIQATDVTERVLSREVANSRENQMYKQWLELEAIYRTAPVGVILFDARDLRIIHVNEMQAEFLGATSSELQGKSMKDVTFKVPAFKELLEAALSGKQAKNTVIETAVMVPAEKHRAWLVNITPFFDEAGNIERLCSISLEMPSQSWSKTGTYLGGTQT